MKKVVAERVIHKGERRISLSFGYDDTLIGIVKNIEGARWSSQMKSWHIPDGSNIKGNLLDAFRPYVCKNKVSGCLITLNSYELLKY